MARILEITCYLAAFLAFALCLSLAIEVHYLPTVEWIIALVTLGLAPGFGEVSRGELSKPHLLFIWMFSAVFFGAQAVLFYALDVFPGLNSFSFINNCERLMKIFTRELNLSYALGALSVFYIDLIHYWMPLVSVVSFSVLTTLLKTRNRIEEAEQVMDVNRP